MGSVKIQCRANASQVMAVVKTCLCESVYVV